MTSGALSTRFREGDGRVCTPITGRLSRTRSQVPYLPHADPPLHRPIASQTQMEPAAILPAVQGPRGAAAVVRPGLQPGELPAATGAAAVDPQLEPDQLA